MLKKTIDSCVTQGCILFKDGRGAHLESLLGDDILFKIGEFSKLCGLSVDTLYHYEKRKKHSGMEVQEAQLFKQI